MIKKGIINGMVSLRRVSSAFPALRGLFLLPVVPLLFYFFPVPAVMILSVIDSSISKVFIMIRSIFTDQRIMRGLLKAVLTDLLDHGFIISVHECFLLFINQQCKEAADEFGDFPKNYCPSISRPEGLRGYWTAGRAWFFRRNSLPLCRAAGNHRS